MTAPLTLAGAATGPWIEPPPPRKERRRMCVTVRTDTGMRYEYEGLYSNTFAAYDDAMERFALAARIEVRPVPAGTHPTGRRRTDTPDGDAHHAP